SAGSLAQAESDRPESDRPRAATAVRRSMFLSSKRGTRSRSLPFQLDIPVQPVDPAFVQIVRRKGAAIVLQLPARRAPRLAMEGHVRLLRRPAALLQVARRAGGGDIFPARPPAQPPRHHMIEGQLLARPAIL